MEFNEKKGDEREKDIIDYLKAIADIGKSPIYLLFI